MPQPICPKCSRNYTKRVARVGFKERLLSIIYVYPFRCQLCGHRFGFMQWGVRYMRMEEDRREYDRIKCSFPVSFAGDHLNGSGAIVEISINGCALQASTELAEGNIIRMALRISDEAPPVQIEAAVVRAVRKSHIGIEFLRFQYDDRDRLQSFIRGLLLKQKS